MKSPTCPEEEFGPLEYQEFEPVQEERTAMSHTPWTQEQAEKWADEALPDKLRVLSCDRAAIFRMGFNLALAKAAEMIEASPTVYGTPTAGFDADRYPSDTHRAKLVGGQEIEGET